MKTKNNLLILFLSVLNIGIFTISCSKNETTEDKSSNISFDAAYVVNGESNTISVISLETNTVKETFTLSNLKSMESGSMSMNMDNMWPHHIYLSPDGSKIAIAAPGMDFSGGHDMMGDTASSGSSTDSHSQHHGGSTGGGTTAEMKMQGRILILDASTGKLLKELELDGMTHNAIFSPDGKELWTALMMPEGKVKIFDANTFVLQKSITVGQMPAEITFSEDGKKVFVANGMSNTVSVIDAITKQVVDTIETGDEPVGAWPGMGGMMYVDNEEGESISIINSMTNMMEDTVHLGFMPGMAARNTTMNQMWVSDPQNSKIHYWNKTESGLVHQGEVTVGEGAHAIAFSKDGKKCYVTNQLEGTVSVVDVELKSELLKIPVGVKPNGIVIRYK